ncbi:membrane protein [Capsulimonas corticalis]|uniref:Membrane protein n=1 Tax=Capsulimonas corticalis TaxID=2219043 RepID=A0A402D755_9BACT|nr:membrane protein [Capsulimonas corticalis]
MYGGQAVIEGVMMRSPRFFSIACRRRSDQQIVVKLEPVEQIVPPFLAFLRKPFLRGTLALIDAMAMGIKALTYSANIQMEDETGAASAPEDRKAASAANLALGEGVAERDGIRPARHGSAPLAPAAAAKAAAPQSINGIAIGATTVISLLLGYALFWVIPGALTDQILPHHHATQHAWRLQIGGSLIEGAIRLVVFFVYLALIARLAHVQRVFEYHGAEHKAINTLEAGQDLTLDNVRAASRIHPRCGTNFIFIVLTTAIFVFTIIPRHAISEGVGPALTSVLLRLLLLPVVAGVSFEILKFAGSHRDKAWAQAMIAPGLWTQYITTRVPDDSQLEVSIASLKSVWDKEHESGPASKSSDAEPAAEVA